MNYTDEEIERAKAIFARGKHVGVPEHMTVAVMVGFSRPNKMSRVTHKRTWRDCLPKARRELRDERSQ